MVQYMSTSPRKSKTPGPDKPAKVAKPRRPGLPVVALWISLDMPYGRMVLKGILDYLKRKPNWSIPLHGVEAVNQPVEFVRKHASGLIGQFYTPEQVRQALSFGIPVVNLTQGPPNSDIPSVCLDNLKIGRMAAGHLIEVGCGNLYCVGDEQVGYANYRWQGFQQMATEMGVPVKLLPVTLNCPPAQIINPIHFSSMIRHLPPASGVFGVNDIVAFGFLRACVKAGKSIPADVAVVGCNDDDIICQLPSPSMTSIQTPGHEVGYRAAELLDSLFERTLGDLPKHQLVNPGLLVPRESSDRLVTLDANLAQALRYIRQHAKEPIYVTDVVDANRLGRRALENLFKEHIGHGIYEEIRRAHLSHAEGLLKNSDLTISQIAVKSGFASTPCLERAFFKKYKCSAATWRDANHAKMVR